MYQRKRRLFDHVVLHVRDLHESKKFYRAVVETLGHTITREEADHFFIGELEIRQNPETSRSVHLAFQAENPGSVKLFHETALRNGGTCVGVPVSAEPGVYAANVLDPDGNCIEAIFKKFQKPVSISY